MLLLIWADEKYNTQKNPGVFHRPKKIPFGQNVRPKKILRTPPSLKYVSGAPGFWTILSLGVPGSKEPGKFKFWGSCLVNIKLARPPITENSLNVGGRFMWKFWKTTTVHQPDKISDWSVVWVTFSVHFNLPDRHQRITNKLIQARRNSDEWKEQQNWNNFCEMITLFSKECSLRDELQHCVTTAPFCWHPRRLVRI